MTERVTQRRPNGTGSLRQRRDGRWEYRVVIAGRQRSFYGRTEADALSAPERAPHSGHDAVTVAAFMSDWVAGTRQSMRPNTYLSYESAVRVHINPALGGMRLTELRPAHVVRFRDHLSRRVNPTTTRRVLVTLGTGLQTAVDQGMVASNAARAVRKPRIADPNRIILSRDAAGQLLAAARGDRLEALYRLALSTGMRLGELLALRWEDVDLDQRLLHVTGDATEDPGGRPTRIARSAAEQRSIMLTRSTVRVLARTPRSPWLVFPTARGTLMDRHNFTARAWVPLMQRARLPAMRFHDLRHTAAMHLLEDGVPIHAVSRLLGHASVAITVGMYEYPTAQMSDAAVKAMEARYPT